MNIQIEVSAYAAVWCMFHFQQNTLPDDTEKEIYSF